MRQPTHSVEIALFVILICGVLVGLVAAFTAPDFYEFVLSAEDGPLEWITAIALLFASLLCLRRVFVRRQLGARFVAITTFAAIILFFGAGEEISWGQRVIGWSSGEFWQKHNAQDETNLHNLMVGEIKINRLLFGVALTIALLIYFAVLPILCSRSARFHTFIASWHIPVPRARHSAAFLLSLVAMAIIPAGRAPELGEFALGLLLAAVVLNPVNKSQIL